MRHELTTRIVLGITALFVAACVVFAVVAVRSTDADPRIGSVLELEGDLGAGELVYLERAVPSCAQCHSLVAAGARSDRAVDLDVVRPTRREVVVSILGGQVGAHEAQGYRVELSDRQIADLAAYVAAAAGG